MKIGELAAATGLSTSAIRFYEQSGLLPRTARHANGYRHYTEAAVQRLRVIQMAQRLGFSLESLRSVFTVESGFSKAELLQRLDGRLAELDQLMSDLRSQRQELRSLRATLDRAWAAGECVQVGALAEQLPAKPRRRSG